MVNWIVRETKVKKAEKKINQSKYTWPKGTKIVKSKGQALDQVIGFCLLFHS